MNLLLDIGNSRIKWALSNDDDWTVGEPLLREGKAFKDIARPAWKTLDTPERVIVSTVSGADFEKSVRTWVKRRWKVDPEFLVAEESCCEVTNAYKTPTDLGADRWAALLAVHSLYSCPCCVIDCGTALTIDVLAVDGSHQGGLIVPGLDLMVSSLTGAADQISLETDSVEEISLMARDTASAVKGGALYTTVAALDRICADILGVMGREMRVIMTGGDVQRVMPLLDLHTQPELIPDLVLRGLAVYSNQSIAESMEVV
ncbi:MAG: type III pantothenate kinase [Gammaproteobacteria bacterium]